MVWDCTSFDAFLRIFYCFLCYKNRNLKHENAALHGIISLGKNIIPGKKIQEIIVLGKPNQESFFVFLHANYCFSTLVRYACSAPSFRSTFTKISYLFLAHLKLVNYDDFDIPWFWVFEFLRSRNKWFLKKICPKNCFLKKEFPIFRFLSMMLPEFHFTDFFFSICFSCTFISCTNNIPVALYSWFLRVPPKKNNLLKLKLWLLLIFNSSPQFRNCLCEIELKSVLLITYNVKWYTVMKLNLTA